MFRKLMTLSMESLREQFMGAGKKINCEVLMNFKSWNWASIAMSAVSYISETLLIVK